MSAQDFYGASYARGDQKKLDIAFQRFEMALKATNESLQNKALDLAAKMEKEAFDS